MNRLIILLAALCELSLFAMSRTTLIQRLEIISGLERGNKIFEELLSALVMGQRKQLRDVGRGIDLRYRADSDLLFVRQFTVDENQTTIYSEETIIGGDFPDCRQPFQCLVASEHIAPYVWALIDGKTVAQKIPLPDDRQWFFDEIEFKLAGDTLQQRQLADGKIVADWQDVELNLYRTLNEIKNYEERWQLIDVVLRLFSNKQTELPTKSKILLTASWLKELDLSSRFDVDLESRTIDELGEIYLKQLEVWYLTAFKMGGAIGEIDSIDNVKILLAEMTNLIKATIDQQIVDTSNYPLLQKKFIVHDDDHELLAYKLLARHTRAMQKVINRDLITHIDQILANGDEIADLLELRDKIELMKLQHGQLRATFGQLIQQQLARQLLVLTRRKIVALAEHDGPDWSWAILGGNKRVIVTKKFAQQYLLHAYDIVNFSIDRVLATFSSNHKNYPGLENIVENLKEALPGGAIKRNSSGIITNDSYVEAIYGQYGVVDDNYDPVYQVRYWSKQITNNRHLNGGHRLYVQLIKIAGIDHLVLIDWFYKKIVSSKNAPYLKNKQGKIIIPRARQYFHNIKNDIENQLYRLADIELEKKARQ